MTQTTSLIEEWRRIGPALWAESAHGWLIDGAPIVLTDWQRAVLDCWFAYKSDISTLAVSNIKKSGKTTVDAILTCWRWLCLPSRHFCAANDLDQSASLVFSMIAEMVRKHPYLGRNTKATAGRLEFLATGSSLEALAVDAAGNAGANFMTASHTESWGIILEGAVRSFEELTPPPGTVYGFPALRICDSYAGWLGESQVWHSIVDRGLGGERLPGPWPIFKVGGLLLFHMAGLEAQERCFRGGSLEREAYYREQAATLRPNTNARLHLNERATNESRFVEAEAWSACYDPDLKAWTQGDTRALVLGADASTSRDFTALVGCTYDGRRVGAIFTRVWKPEHSFLRGGKGTIDLEATIGQEVLDLHAAGHVSAVVADPYQLHTLIVKWEKAGLKVIELAQNAGRVESDQALYDAIQSRSLAHVNNRELNEAIANAVAIETARGLRLAKEKASKKIDAAVALSMGHYGALRRLAMNAPLSTMQNIFMDEGLCAEWMAGREERPHKVEVIRRSILTTRGNFRIQ